MMIANNKGIADPNGKDNQLLAGYLAHEFLTRGTLLGQDWDPARAEATPILPRRPSLKIQKESAPATANVKAAEPVLIAKQYQSYTDVSNLLKCDGVNIKGIFNPAQLTRWLKM